VRRSALLLLALVLAGCGSGGKTSGIAIPTPKQFRVAGFAPTTTVQPGKPFTVSFTIEQPSGKPLTAYKTGPGPHTGVHLIFVRRDLAAIVHLHPKSIGADGLVRDEVTLPEAGPYELLIDAYADIPGQPFSNFQLRQSLQVAGSYAAQPLPAFNPRVVVDGYTFTMTTKPQLRSLSVAPVTVRVTGPDGKPVRFTPWFGALAHAIFFRRGGLDYYHTHVCAPSAPNCAGRPGAPTTRTATPGLIKAVAILPVPGVWRLFIQCQVDGHVLTAPYTLRVS
jgi:hypothetical protein